MIGDCSHHSLSTLFLKASTQIIVSRVNLICYRWENRRKTWVLWCLIDGPVPNRLFQSRCLLMGSQVAWLFKKVLCGILMCITYVVNMWSPLAYSYFLHNFWAVGFSVGRNFDAHVIIRTEIGFNCKQKVHLLLEWSHCLNCLKF